MQRTSMRLADGRELIYFDDAPGAQRRLDDPRDLAPATTLSEVRYDAMLDEWVTVASHRQGRTHLPPADECPRHRSAVTDAFASHDFGPPAIFAAEPGPGATRLT